MSLVTGNRLFRFTVLLSKTTLSVFRIPEKVPEKGSCILKKLRQKQIESFDTTSFSTAPMDTQGWTELFF